MKIVIFGATGSVGKQLVMQALALGHQVTAFARSRNNSLEELEHEHLRIVTGNVFDPLSVEKAVAGCEAVFCVLGAGRKGRVRTEGTRNIIAAMERLGVKRLICQSTLGVGDSRSNLNFFWKHIMFGWLLKEAYRDHQQQEELVKSTDLDWTIVRPSAFTDGKATGNFKHGFGPDEKGITIKISRADVAMFLLEQLETDLYLRKTPALSY